MPELPEVESIKNSLLDVVGGLTVDSVHWDPQKTLRKSKLPALTEFIGKRLIDIRRRGKYMGFIFDNNRVLISHLGMSGTWLFTDKRSQVPPNLEPHAHVWIQFNNDRRERRRITYIDPRRFGIMLIIDGDGVKDYFQNMGREPFSDRFTPQYITAKLKPYKKSIKTWLLDQGNIAGVGNIYASEICFYAKIKPDTPAKDCAEYSKSIHEGTILILKRAIESGGSTIHSFAGADGESGAAQKYHMVYGREGLNCLREGCKGVIQKVVLDDGRSSYYCPKCQK